MPSATYNLITIQTKKDDGPACKSRKLWAVAHLTPK